MSARAETDVAQTTLAWPGRTWQPSAGFDASSREFRREIVVDETTEGPSGRLIRGDALDVARALLAEGLGGCVDLVYLDPPFASQARYESEARLDGAATGRVKRTVAYEDTWRDSGGGIGAYLDMLAVRLEAAAKLLAPTGSLWVHLDWRASYLVRVILDEIFGRHRFINEIVWRRAPNLGRQAASFQFGRTLDTILVYGSTARLVPPMRLEPVEPSAMRGNDQGRPFTLAPRGDYTDKSIAKLEAQGRVHRTASGKVYIKYLLVPDAEGRWCRERRVDTLWTDVPALRHAAVGERTGFPTQKPRALLDRIVRCACPEGGLVVDLFAGSGTTGEAAHAARRRFVLGDAGPVAVAVARARLLRANAAVSVERIGQDEPTGPGAEVAARRATDGGIEVELVSPVEPLAWAIDTLREEDRPFRVAWHSERRPGTKTIRAESLARLTGGQRLGVRVYSDDGTVSKCEATVP